VEQTRYQKRVETFFYLNLILRYFRTYGVLCWVRVLCVVRPCFKIIRIRRESKY